MQDDFDLWKDKEDLLSLRSLEDKISNKEIYIKEKQNKLEVFYVKDKVYKTDIFNYYNIKYKVCADEGALESVHSEN